LIAQSPLLRPYVCAVSAFGEAKAWAAGIAALGYPPTWIDMTEETIKIHKALFGQNITK